MRRCDLVRELTGLNNLRFVCGDVLHELSRARSLSTSSWPPASCTTYLTPTRF